VIYGRQIKRPVELIYRRKHTKKISHLARSKDKHKNLPSQVKKMTVNIPPTLLSSNLFFFDTKQRFFLNNFKLSGKWFQKECSFYASGESLNGYDQRIFLALMVV